MRFYHYLRMATPFLCSLSVTRSFMLPRTSSISTSSLIMRARKNNRSDEPLFDNDHYTSKRRNMAPDYNPRTPAQTTYVNALENRDLPIVFGIGPAGCGKTLFACLTAVKELRAGKIKKIVLTRPIVPVEEEEIGFLPGSLVKKMDPWTRPIFDILLEFYPQRDLDHMVQNGVIEISPLAFMRGRTFKQSFIIADEMQNSTPNQMMMLTTRIGDDSKMIITGDLKQTDRDLLGNGLSDLIRKVEDYQADIMPSHVDTDSVFPIKYKKDIEIVRMTSSDVQRNPIVTRILDIYQYKKPSGDVISDLNTMISQQEVIERNDHLVSALDNHDTKKTKTTTKKTDTKSNNKQNTKIVDSNMDSALIPKDRLPKSET